MPARDGTGPMGMGAMTGRAAGNCVGYATPRGWPRLPGCGLGFGRGRGLGLGLGRGGRWGAMATGAVPVAPQAVPASVPPPPEWERTALSNQAQHLEGLLAGIRERLAELGSTRSDTEQGGER
jgi:hypothetical protein